MVFIKGNDFVHSSFWSEAPPLTLLDLLRITSAFLDEVDDIEHGDEELTSIQEANQLLGVVFR